MPAPRPTLNRSAGNISGADHNIRLLQSIHQLGEIPGRMAVVGIHRNQRGVRMFHRIFHGSNMGRPKPELAWANQAMEARLRARTFEAPLSRAIGRLVIDYQYVGGRQNRQDFVNESRQILNFVVGGDSN